MTREEVGLLKGFCWFVLCWHIYDWFLESNPFAHMCVQEIDLCFWHISREFTAEWKLFAFPQRSVMRPTLRSIPPHATKSSGARSTVQYTPLPQYLVFRLFWPRRSKEKQRSSLFPWLFHGSVYSCYRNHVFLDTRGTGLSSLSPVLVGKTAQL